MSRPTKCPECGSTLLRWDYRIKFPPRPEQARVVECWLGCEECSETVHFENLDELLDRQTLIDQAVNTLVHGFDRIATDVSYEPPPICAVDDHDLVCGCGSPADHGHDGSHAPTAVGCVACERGMEELSAQRAAERTEPSEQGGE